MTAARAFVESWRRRKSAAFEHQDSYGFVKLYGLPGAVAQRVQGGGS